MEADSLGAGAVIPLSAAAIKALAEKLKAHKIRAFPSKAEYEAQQGLKSSPEYRSYKAVVRDRAHLEGCLLGMRLRDLQGQDEEIRRIKEFTRKKRGAEKVWIAQAVEVGALQRLLVLLQERGYSPDEQRRQVDDFLSNITRCLMLVTTEYAAKFWVDEAVAHLRGGPLIYCIAGSGHAEDIARKVINDVNKVAFNHRGEPVSESRRITAFFILLSPGEKRPESPLKPKKATRQKSRRHRML